MSGIKITEEEFKPSDVIGIGNLRDHRKIASLVFDPETERSFSATQDARSFPIFIKIEGVKYVACIAFSGEELVENNVSPDTLLKLFYEKRKQASIKPGPLGNLKNMDRKFKQLVRSLNG
jgi:hypothetical protein